MEKTFKIDTYPHVYLDYDSGIENTDYDDTMLVFEVPMEWATRWIQKDYTLEEFLNEYTWDWTLEMYEDAISEGVLLGETAVERFNYIK